jgi:hypothetical protein
MPNDKTPKTFFPVLCYVLILVMIGVSWGSALSFFADRYRWPLLTLLIAFSVALHTLVLNSKPFEALEDKLGTSSDHYYALLDSSKPPYWLEPKQVLNQWHERHNQDECPLVVVTATGGGILAAAWTAEVLTKLQETLQTAPCQRGAKDNAFNSSIVLISSVSGGSVGAMYFADALAESRGGFQNVNLPSGCPAFSVPGVAQASSLREAAWGLAYPGVLRTAAPVLAAKTLDGGWAVEQAWQRCWPGKGRSLYGWAQALNDGKMPAVILNSTTAETGQRFLLTNYRPLDKAPQANGDAPVLFPTPSFVNNYGNYDLPVVTAARLSATFPYVTATSRANVAKGSTFHLADGGYFDNFGITSAVEWILQATSTEPSSSQRSAGIQDMFQGRRLLLVEIMASPKQDNSSPEKVEENLSGALWDWTNQAIAPISTLVNVRTTGQAEHNEVALKMLNDLQPAGMKFLRVQFPFYEANAPLSWHLTQPQRASIGASWGNQASQLQEVKEAFGYPAPNNSSAEARRP